MEKKIDFTVKHREDVIDILQVRAKEKKVLIGLIIILLCTLAYENSEILGKMLFNYEFSVPELGKRKPPLINVDVLKSLGRRLGKVGQQFPQFVLTFSRIQSELAKTAALAANEDTRQQATYNTFMICREIYKFAHNPVLQESKELKELQDELKALQKRFKFALQTDDGIKPVTFINIEDDQQQANIHRNLFDYDIF